MILLKAFYFLLLSFGLHADSIPEQENGSLVLEHFTQRITNIAERCIPAVVKVAALRTANNSSMDLRDRVFFGSGCLVSSEGHIVTCNHVIKDAVCFSVYFESQEIEARLIQVIPEIDIAILKIDGRNLPYLELGDSDSLSIGEWVISIGFPFSLSPFISRGIIGSVDDPGGSLILDILTCPGNSGGPLLNLDGEVIGINSALLQFGQEIRGAGVAIPINQINRHMLHLD